MYIYKLTFSFQNGTLFLEKVGVKMAKFCPKCGAELDDTAIVCDKCGENLSASQTQSSNVETGVVGTVQKRDIVVAIILSLVTCGIYGIYWFICLTNDSNKASGDYKTSGGMAFLLTLVTCGIYGWYWYYQMGKKMVQAGANNGVAIEDNSVLYLILGIFGLGIVDYCLIQSDLNKIATK